MTEASLSKRGLVHNRSYENEFNLDVIKISFSHERTGTKTRFKEAKAKFGNGLLDNESHDVSYLYTCFLRLVSAMFPRNHFSHIFIDEAGHATEPECIIPVADLLDPNHPTGGQLVLAGDPKQLGPILRSPISVKYGLGEYVVAASMTTMK